MEEHMIAQFNEKGTMLALHFYENVRSRYSETGDLREYFSSMTIGTQCTIKKDMIVVTGDKEDVRSMIADFYFDEYPGTASYMDEDKGVIFADKGESTIDICRDSFWGDHLEYQLFPAQLP